MSGLVLSIQLYSNHTVLVCHVRTDSANVTTEASSTLARTLSAASTVLLKNEGGVLPLKKTAKLAVIGLADTQNALTHA